MSKVNLNRFLVRSFAINRRLADSKNPKYHDETERVIYFDVLSSDIYEIFSLSMTKRDHCNGQIGRQEWSWRLLQLCKRVCLHNGNYFKIWCLSWIKTNLLLTRGRGGGLFWNDFWTIYRNGTKHHFEQRLIRLIAWLELWNL